MSQMKVYHLEFRVEKMEKRSPVAVMDTTRNIFIEKSFGNYYWESYIFFHHSVIFGFVLLVFKLFF